MDKLCSKVVGRCLSGVWFSKLNEQIAGSMSRLFCAYKVESAKIIFHGEL